MNWNEIYGLLKIEEATRGHPQLAAIKNLAYHELLLANDEATKEWDELTAKAKEEADADAAAAREAAAEDIAASEEAAAAQAETDAQVQAENQRAAKVELRRQALAAGGAAAQAQRQKDLEDAQAAESEPVEVTPTDRVTQSDVGRRV